MMTRREPLYRLALPALACALLAGALRAAEPVPGPTTPEPERPEPRMPGNLAQGWYAMIETSLGTIVARLLPEQAPQSVAHFAAIAEGRLPWIDPLTGTTKQGHYYDGLRVHLAVAAQRFETGDPTGTGRGYPLIYVPPEGRGPITFDAPGRLGMTRSSLGRISGVQFFVTAAALPWLVGHHPCFAEVVSGMEVVSAIAGVRTRTNGRPETPVIVERVRIRKVGEPAPLPDPVPFVPKPPEFGLK
jgi:peptidyl-prolyl cis-trans isomerase A (cyclophilin A)